MRPDFSQKTGRNDPCPCGSGKKYKRCCLNKETVPENPVLAQIDAARNHAVKEIADYLTSKFRDRLIEAWDAFTFGAEELPDLDAPDLLFLHFAMFHWDPDYSDEESTNFREGGIVARSFLQHRSYRLTELEQQIVKLFMTEPLSFYEILSCRPGEGYRVRDLWTENEFEVIDDLGSKDLLAGDISYAQLLRVSGIITVGMASATIIPAEMKPAILEYREILREGDDNAPSRFSSDDVRRHQEDLRELYFEVEDALGATGVPYNTDDEPFALHTLTFEIDSADHAFDALAPLAAGIPKKDLLADAIFDAQGKIADIEFPWLKQGNTEFKSFDNTVLAMFRISDRTLTVEANSENRATQVRDEVEKRLGAAAVYKATMVESYDEVLEQKPEKALSVKSAAVSDEILHSPEAQNAARELLQREVDGWASQKIPALGNRTPLEAVKDPETRETVESLVQHYERTLRHNFPPDIRPHVSNLRRLLEL
jgi:hypothetical protein